MRVVIVSSIQAVRAGLRVMLSESDRLAALYDAAELAAAEAWLEEADVLVLTAEAFSLPGLQAIARQHEGRLAVLLLTGDRQAAQSLVGLPLRAWGALTPDCSVEELNAAVSALDEGLFVGAPALFKAALAPMLSGSVLALETEGDPVESLTQREVEVLQLLALGLANKQIAVRLQISEHTIKFHVSSIYSRLGVTNRTEAVRFGLQRGLITL